MRLRFLLPVLAVTGIFAGFLLLWLPGEFEEQIREEVIQRAQLAAEVLDKSAIGALTIEDRGALNQLAKGLIRSKDLRYILILDKDQHVLADSGLERQDLEVVQSHVPNLLHAQGNRQSSMQWPSTGETVLNLGRPVFYEQLPIGSIVLGISAQQPALRADLLRRQLLLLGAVPLAIGLGLAFFLSNSLASKIRRISVGIDALSDSEMEKAAGKVRELNLLVEQLIKNRNLLKVSMSELESTKLRLETELTENRQENADLNLRLGSMTKQIEGMQNQLRTMEQDSKGLSHILPLVQFATGIAPEIDAAMQHISQSAGRLNEDLGRIRNLIGLYEKAFPQTPEDLEVIRQYKAFIQYDKIRETMEELVTTIRGGASWSEQLADLLRQLSVTQSPQAR